MHIIGCVKAKELTTCKTGANQHAHIVLRKNVVSGQDTGGESVTPEPNSETDTMTIAAMKRIATMSDVTKSYFGGLEDAAAEAFLAKSACDQDAEAAAAKKTADAKAAELEAAKSGHTAKEAELHKSISDLQAENAEIKKALADNAATAELEKTAASADFAGYPGGSTALVPMLKVAAGLPEADRTAMHAVLKANAKAAKLSTTSFGIRATEEEFEKAQPANAEIQKKAKALQDKEPELSDGEAMARVIKAHPQLMMAGLNEENAALN